MIRHPVLDFFTGAALALGGPMAFMLPQRIFIEMISAGMTPDPKPLSPARSRRTGV